MLSRRELLLRGARAGAAVALGPTACSWSQDEAPSGEWVNDVHSGLNRTHVLGIEYPGSQDELQELVRSASAQGRAISVAGGRHAMGGQQFGSETLLLDMNGLTGLSALDSQRGLVEVAGGTQWPQIVAGLLEMQGDRPRWGPGSPPKLKGSLMSTGTWPM